MAFLGREGAGWWVFTEKASVLPGHHKASHLQQLVTKEGKGDEGQWFWDSKEGFSSSHPDGACSSKEHKGKGE